METDSTKLLVITTLQKVNYLRLAHVFFYYGNSMCRRKIMMINMKLRDVNEISLKAEKIFITKSQYQKHNNFNIPHDNKRYYSYDIYIGTYSASRCVGEGERIQYRYSYCKLIQNL